MVNVKLLIHNFHLNLSILKLQQLQCECSARLVSVDYLDMTKDIGDSEDIL